jgi:hypothetical protein
MSEPLLKMPVVRCWVEGYRVDFLVPAAVLAVGAVAVYGFQKSGSALIHSSAT